MSRRSDRVLTIQIAGLQAFYWMAFCPIYSFASVYLLSKGFSNQEIGWVMALSNVLAIILQPALGVLIDRLRKLSIRTVMSVMTLLCILMLAVMAFFDLSGLWIAILYVGTSALLLSMQPLVNALTFEYINFGHDVNFGITRATGSVSFAVLSTLLGIWVGRSSTAILPVICLGLFAGFFFLVLSFKSTDRALHSPSSLKVPDAPGSGTATIGFLWKYERFIPFLLGMVGLFLFHNVINTFLIQIMNSVGGQDREFGISLTIAALCEMPAFIGFKWLVSRFGTRSLLKASGVFYALRSFVFLLAGTVWMVNLGQVIQGVSFALLIPASIYYVNQVMQEEDKVKGQTFITGAATAGSFFGSVIGGRLLDSSGVTGLLTFGAVGAVAGCLLLVYAVGWRKTVDAVADNA